MNKKDVLVIIAIIVGVILLIFLLTSLIVRIHEFEGLDEYNNGQCAQCGGIYVYQQAVGHQYFTYYVYICDHCGKMIETGRYMGR